MRVRLLRGVPIIMNTVWLVQTNGFTNCLHYNRKSAEAWAVKSHATLDHDWEPIERPGDMFDCARCEISIEEWLLFGEPN